MDCFFLGRGRSGNRHRMNSQQSGAFLCQCAYGYYGTTCGSFDPCTLQPCLNDGECFNSTSLPGGYRCSCPLGYFGYNCSRLDPCSSSPCQNHGRCTNYTDTHYSCACRAGFHG